MAKKTAEIPAHIRNEMPTGGTWTYTEWLVNGLRPLSIGWRYRLTHDSGFAVEGGEIGTGVDQPMTRIR